MGEDFTREEEVLGQGWDDCDKVASSSGLFVKLGDGDTIALACVGDPIPIKRAPFAPGEAPSVRYRIDVWPVGGDELKTWEMSKTVFGLLKRQRARRSDTFARCVFELERKGSGKSDTTYFLEYVRDLSTEELATIEGIRSVNKVNESTF